MRGVTIDLATLEFGEPAYLVLLAAPGILCLVWSWRLLRRALDVRRHTRVQVVPQPHRFSAISDLGFWFCLILASSLCIVALGRPAVRVAGVAASDADLVVSVDSSGEPDRDIVVRIVSSVSRPSTEAGDAERREELYWRFLCAAAILVGAGTCLLRQPAELWWQAGVAAVAMLIIAAMAG